MVQQGIKELGNPLHDRPPLKRPLEHAGEFLPLEFGDWGKKVDLARAMVNKPDILFADEPCANLDSENSKMVLELFHEINEEMQQTIIMVSHEDWHKDYFHRIVRLKDGKVTSDGTP